MACRLQHLLGHEAAERMPQLHREDAVIVHAQPVGHVGVQLRDLEIVGAPASDNVGRERQRAVAGVEQFLRFFEQPIIRGAVAVQQADRRGGRGGLAAEQRDRVGGRPGSVQPHPTMQAGEQGQVGDRGGDGQHGRGTLAKRGRSGGTGGQAVRDSAGEQPAERRDPTDPGIAPAGPFRRREGARQRVRIPAWRMPALLAARFVSRP